MKKLLVLLISVVGTIGIATADSTPFPCGKCSSSSKKGYVKDYYGNWIVCPACGGTGNQPNAEQNSSESRTNNNRSNGQSYLEPTKFPEASKCECGGKGGWWISGKWVPCNKCKNR